MWWRIPVATDHSRGTRAERSHGALDKPARRHHIYDRPATSTDMSDGLPTRPNCSRWSSAESSNSPVPTFLTSPPPGRQTGGLAAPPRADHRRGSADEAVHWFFTYEAAVQVGIQALRGVLSFEWWWHPA
jgi:hypothetical protein